ncbi:S1 family peptidase [Saccharothrix obliqua]|uniref:S1 family peptidase n=1 Tax=Saccharothrix obliqua TaxID=2861747 RepID=UPI001C5F0B90|nr:serine protease [Saccharothrix obliqua]MBW4718643.1 serine protease [Saccharothrix obliqua]
MPPHIRAALGTATALLIALGVPANGSATPSDAARPRIVNGAPSTQVYPFMASLQDAATGEHSCGAVLIAPRWLLTAAHCVRDWDGALHHQARIGTQDRTTGGTVLSVLETHVHPAYTEVSAGNDIALAKLYGSAPQQPIRIAPPEEAVPTTPTRLLGWGNPEASQWAQCGAPVTLHWLNTSITEPAGCGADLREKDLCTHNPNGNAGSCWGDSGGPQITYPEHRLLGVSSRLTTDFCGARPSIYTDATRHRDWITTVTGPLP